MATLSVWGLDDSERLRGSEAKVNLAASAFSGEQLGAEGEWPVDAYRVVDLFTEPHAHFVALYLSTCPTLWGTSFRIHYGHVIRYDTYTYAVCMNIYL